MNIPTRSSHPRILFPIFLIMLVVLITQLNRHALERHPFDAPRAVECLDRNGVDFEMVDPNTDRIVKVCHEPNQSAWYILIFTGMGAIVTAYCRQRAKCRRDVEVYLRDGGWEYKRRK